MTADDFELEVAEALAGCRKSKSPVCPGHVLVYLRGKPMEFVYGHCGGRRWLPIHAVFPEHDFEHCLTLEDAIRATLVHKKFASWHPTDFDKKQASPKLWY